jgi:hemerythrin
LHDELTASREEPSIEAFFGDLFKGISAHFALEERFMRERRYDQLAQHKVDHERLLDEIRDIMDGYELHGRYDPGALGTALDAWFTVHFRTHDARLHHALAT